MNPSCKMTAGTCKGMAWPCTPPGNFRKQKDVKTSPRFLKERQEPEKIMGFAVPEKAEARCPFSGALGYGWVQKGEEPI